MYVATLLALIHPIARHLEPTPYLVFISVVFMHPSRTVGAQLEVTIFSLIGAIIAAIWVAPCQAVIAAYNRDHYEGGTSPAWAICASWFFIGIWWMTTLKTIYAKLTFTALLFSIILAFTLTENATSTSFIFQLHYFWKITGPLLIGVGISQAVNILFWPETANQSLGRALNESLDSSRALLNLSTRSFLLNHKTIALPKSAMETAQSEVQAAQKKLFNAYKEARYELTYSFINPTEYKPVRLILSTMMRHLGSMSLVVQNERLLMLGDPENYLDQLSQSNSDYDSSDGDSDGETGHFTSGYNTTSRSSFHELGDHFQSPTDSPQNSRPQSRYRNEQGSVGTTDDNSKSRNSNLKRKSSTAEIRRIRQLLQRAENSTQAAIAAKKQHQEKLHKKTLEDLLQTFQSSHGGIATEPATPSAGAKLNIYDKLHRTKYPNHTIGYYGENPSHYLSPYSTRPNSIHEAQNQDTTKSLKSLFSTKSKPSFKSNRPASLKAGFKVNHEMIEKEVLDNSQSASRHPSDENLPQALDGVAPSLPIDTSQTFLKQPSVDALFSRSSITDQQAKKASEAFKKRMKKEARKEREKRKKAAKEERKRSERTENERRADAAIGVVLAKEVAYGDRKLFISFLDIVRDPIQRLSDTCSKVMVAMEKEVVSGLSAENDRLERIRIRNARRADAIRAADVVVAAEEKANIAKENLHGSEGTPKEDVEKEGDKNILPLSRLSKFLVSIGFMRRQLTADDIAYAKVLKASMQRDIKDGITPVNSNPSKQDSQKNATMSGIDSDEDFKLPPNVTFTQFMAGELEIFDKAEADGLQNFISSHPTLDVGPREELFLIFFFMFAIREIACELLSLGKFIEKMKKKSLEKMMEENRVKPTKKLWWPKVMNNFWRWFSWGGYSQLKTGQGLGSMTLGSAKNMEPKQLRSITEEKAILEAKAVKAAEEKRVAKAVIEKQATSRRRRQSESWGVLRRIDPLPAALPHINNSSNQDLGSQWHRRGSQDTPLRSVSPGHSPRMHKSVSLRFRQTKSDPGQVDLEPLDFPSVVGDDRQFTSHTPGSENEEMDIQIKQRSKRLQQYTIVDIPDFKDLHPNLDKELSQTEDVRAKDLITCSTVDVPHCNVLESDSPRGSTFQGKGNLETTKGVDIESRRAQEGYISEKNEDSEERCESLVGNGTGANNQDSDDKGRSWLSWKTFSTLRHHQNSTSAVPSLGENKQDEISPSTVLKSSTATVKKRKRLRFRIWQFMQPFKTDEVKFGFKMAAGLTLCGLLTWLDLRSKFLVSDRGQWSMMTVLAVLTPTVGATLEIGIMRMIGTGVGVGWAVLTFITDPYNPYVICAMMIPIVIVSVYIMLLTPHPKLGLIMSLSFASISFSMYGRNTTDSVYEMAYKRAATVVIGLTIALILNSLLWPILARRQLRMEIAILIRRQGVMFADIISKLLPMNSTDLESNFKLGDILQGFETDDEPEPDGKENTAEYDLVNNSFVERLASKRKVQAETGMSAKHPDYVKKKINPTSHVDASERRAFQHVEQQLQTKMMKILELLSLSESEPKLKEEFPEALYKKIIKCCQNILDRMVSMRMAAQLLSPEVRNLISGSLNTCRRDLRVTGQDHYTYIYYYAFSSALEEVIEELELLAILIKPLVGVTIEVADDLGNSNQQNHGPNASGAFTQNFEADDSSNHPQNQTLILSSALSTGEPEQSADGSIYGAEGLHGLRWRVQNRHKEQVADNQADVYRRQLQEQRQQNDILLQQMREQQALIHEQQLRLQLQQLRLDSISGESTSMPKIVLDKSISPVCSADKNPLADTNPLPTAKLPTATMAESSHSKGRDGNKLETPAFPITTTTTVVTSPALKNALPVVVMDESILESRHKQRFHEALRLAQEVSGEQVTRTQAPVLSITTPVRQNSKGTKSSGSTSCK
ncbi:hypothetical protein BGZ76_008657 [Entomortierella beljakovae]|nr:hypothetical protein BGZ76_008657 [Entomortierella beljakovae]